MSIINHGDTGEDKLVTQFKEAANLIAFIRALLKGSDDLETVFNDLLDNRWIDTAEGVQLDNIGEIVGQERITVLAEGINFFGFTGFPNADSFGDDNDISIGGRFRDSSEPTAGSTPLADPEYRILIRARAAKNNTNATPEEIIAQAQFIVGETEEVYIQEHAEDVRFTLGFGRPLNGNERILVTDAGIIPKPAGVAIEYLEYEAGAVFAFQGVQGAADFNTGKLAEGF